MTQLGITARGTYVQIGDTEIMPHLIDGGGGGAAAETIQSTLIDSGEPIIADRTHTDILEMTCDQRCRWYKRLTAEEKDEAMQLVEMVRRAKMSGENSPAKRPEVRLKISEMAKKQWEDPEFRASMSGENNPMKRPEVRAKRSGEKHHMKRPEVRAKISGEKNPAKRPEVRAKISQLAKKRCKDPEFRVKMSEITKKRMEYPEERAKISKAVKKQWEDTEHRAKISEMTRKQWEDPEHRASLSGENSPSWKGGVSFEPYCPKFNEELKESIRNRDSRTCVVCGKSEILNGRRLAVHHIDSDKTQGCNNKRWYLCALCNSCNSRSDTVEKEFLIVANSDEYRRG